MKTANNKTQFNSLSDDYWDITGNFWKHIREYIDTELFINMEIKKVLDTGNGGLKPEEIFSEQITKQLEIFVGNDINFKMLKRNEYNYRVNSDAFYLPFKKRSFDTILVIGCIHHLGFNKYRERIEKIGILFSGLRELLKKDGRIFIIEPTLPLFFELIERCLIFPLYNIVFPKKAVPIYMYYYRELHEFIDNLFECELVEYKWEYRFSHSKWSLCSPFLFLKWFKIPIGLMPYKYLLCRAKLKSS